MNKRKKHKIIFMGSPDFACPSLKALIADPNFSIVAVYTQADKIRGRRQAPSFTPVKKLAIEHNIPVYQASSLSSELETIKSLGADLIVVVAYGKIIPKNLIELFPLGIINVHASLLPLYRGSACLQAAILNGDTETGVSIMKIDEKLDTGPILAQTSIKIDNKTTISYLHDKLANLGAELLSQTLKKYLAGEIKAKEQDESKASYVPLVKKTDAYLNPSGDAIYLERQIRAYETWPGAYLTLQSKLSPRQEERIKILQAEPILKARSHPIGELRVENKNLILSCGQNELNILRLQRENKKALTSHEFLLGNKDILDYKAI